MILNSAIFQRSSAGWRAGLLVDGTIPKIAPFRGGFPRFDWFSSPVPVSVGAQSAADADIGATNVHSAAIQSFCTDGSFFTCATQNRVQALKRFLPHAMPGGGSMPLASPVPISFPGKVNRNRFFPHLRKGHSFKALGSAVARWCWVPFPVSWEARR